MTRYDSVEKWRKSRKPTVDDGTSDRPIAGARTTVHVLILIYEWGDGPETSCSVYATRDEAVAAFRSYIADRPESEHMPKITDAELDSACRDLIDNGEYFDFYRDGTRVVYSQNDVIGGDDK